MVEESRQDLTANGPASAKAMARQAPINAIGRSFFCYPCHLCNLWCTWCVALAARHRVRRRGLQHSRLLAFIRGCFLISSSPPGSAIWLDLARSLASPVLRTSMSHRPHELHCLACPAERRETSKAILLKLHSATIGFASIRSRDDNRVLW